MAKFTIVNGIIYQESNKSEKIGTVRVRIFNNTTEQVEVCTVVGCFNTSDISILEKDLQTFFKTVHKSNKDFYVMSVKVDIGYEITDFFYLNAIRDNSHKANKSVVNEAIAKAITEYLEKNN